MILRVLEVLLVSLSQWQRVDLAMAQGHAGVGVDLCPGFRRVSQGQRIGRGSASAFDIYWSRGALVQQGFGEVRLHAKRSPWVDSNDL